MSREEDETPATVPGTEGSELPPDAEPNDAMTVESATAEVSACTLRLSSLPGAFSLSVSRASVCNEA
jgi:hypothetical protein